MTLTWIEKLQKQLIRVYGKKQGSLLFNKYAKAFSHSYGDDYAIDTVLKDIESLGQLSAETPTKIIFYIAPEKEHPLHLRLFQREKLIPLSDILPILENFDLRTLSERPYRISYEHQPYQDWISDYAVTYNKQQFDLETVKNLFQDAFIRIYKGECENDGFNKLILGATLTWREVTILRAYSKYLRQVGFRFSQAYIEKSLVNNPQVAKHLVDLFLSLFNPRKTTKHLSSAQIEEKILSQLDFITNLDEDRIIRRLLELIKSTLRTNYFQKEEAGESKKYLSFKLNSRILTDLPLPIPLYEIFVYSPRFEAIHLRNSKVARGGIRWSDRLEDFRTEVLGLMKAQKVKNSIIVPSGAKGGFVLKGSPPNTREGLEIEVISCYKAFISGLLDLTDNIKDKKIIRPKDVVCYDDSDPYLVVAADKGTATFSDIANDISKSYDFWLHDAFASGGATGYDHKKIGITARGAWESIKRHFHELNIDITNTIITMIGIGDMSGDVFGNGLIYSKNVKLLAAFDHRHIFIDPDPDPIISYKERLRLFNLPASSWEDYHPKLLSKGGGIYKRSAKSITITTQMKNTFAIEANSLAPNELIKAILKAPVDLLFNGGIGTYVKASTESHADVGDRTNDYCRVNGEELHCKVVGEGGNLGFTQLGRIEYALQGGIINTDFIDNSAGVDCSDHEVNLKILLDQKIHEKKLTLKKRNELLAAMTDEVAQLVLKDNYDQALVMSFSAFRAKKNIGLHTIYIKELESLNILNRKVEFLPDDKKLIERKAAGEGLTRPELAILLAYTKIHIKNEILNSDLPEDTYLGEIVQTAFPASMRVKYNADMLKHRLHRDIIATQLSNLMVNEMGITFAYRLQMETNALIHEIVRAYIATTYIFDTHSLQNLIIQTLNFKISLSEQYDMLYNIRNLINLATRWFLHDNRMKGDLSKIIKHFSFGVKALETIVPNLMGGITKDYLEKLTEQFIRSGLQKEMARHIATYRAIYTSLNIIEVATKHHFDLIKTAKVYFAAGEKINLLWFRDQIANDSREGHWNTVARLTLRDELDIAQRSLTIAILKNNKKESNTNKLITQWMQKNKHGLVRWERLLSMLHSSTDSDYTMFFIAMRELIGFIVASENSHT